MKGQVTAVGNTEVARRCINIFDVGVARRSFVIVTGMDWLLVGVSDGHDREMLGLARSQALTAFGLREKDLDLGHHKVGLFTVHIILLTLTFFHRYF
jgi:chitin synthase